MSSIRTTTTDLLLLLTSVATISLVSGIGISTYMLRLRDRERLRQATSRVKKTLAGSSQRYALGPAAPQTSTSTSTTTVVVVIGAGAYGTAMAHTAAQNKKNDVVLFMRDAKQCETINNEGYNPKYLSDYSLRNINNTGNSVRGICTKEELSQVLLSSSSSTSTIIILILALPCQKTPDWLVEHRDIIPNDVLIVSTAKGLYVKTKQLIGHAILDALDRAEQPLCFLSGPGFAADIVKGDPTTVVVASDRLYLAVQVQRILSNEKSFRVYTSQDPVGVQLGGALKNPLAVGAGMIAGMGFGINTLSAVITRASHELCELCIAMGGKEETIHGLSGIGDLMLTCFSKKSRNQRCGYRLMHGETMEQITAEFTVEGAATSEVAMVYAELCGLELPLFSMVHALIQHQITPEEAVRRIMTRPLGNETK